jgi:phosphate acetyltransferase
LTQAAGEGFNMDTITRIRNIARSKLKTIVLPEYEDARVVEASRIIEKGGIARAVLLTEDKIDQSEKSRYIEEFYEMHKAKDVDIEKVKELFEGTLYYAAMMTREGKVDGLVAGASHTTPDMARAAIRCLGVDERITIASSCFIMAVPDCEYGEYGTFIFADCGIIPDPNSRQLACIAISAAEMANKVLGLTPRIAFLSYSTKGSAKGKSIEKISEALAQLKEIAPGILADGEMQVDAAIVPEVAKIKYPDSPIGGKANVLIFPNLESGNISYKLVQRLSKARAVGPLLLGLKKPASDLSRGCSVEDIVDCVAVTAIRAQ